MESKGDQKIGNTIANLINLMKELSNLASEHGIEGQLYEGVLAKIITLKVTPGTKNLGVTTLIRVTPKRMAKTFEIS